MVDRHAVESPQKQEVKVFHMTNSRDLADTRCSSSAGVGRFRCDSYSGSLA